MKRKAAIREIVRMRDAGEIGPWEKPYGVWRRSVQGWDHADFVLAATEHNWICYMPVPKSTNTLKGVVGTSSVEQNMAAADAWLASLTAPVKGEKARLRDQLAEAEAKVAELTEDAYRLSAAVGQLSAEVTRLKALNAEMALALAQFSEGG